MTPGRLLRARLQGSSLALDSAIAAAVLAFTVFVRHPDILRGHSVPTTALVFAGLACLPLIVRRRTPRAALALSLAATAVALLLARGEPIFTEASAIALYTVAAWTNRATTIRALAASTLVLAAGAVLMPPAGADLRYFLKAAIGLAPLNVVAAALGDAVRSRRAYILAVEDRAVRAELSREEDARRQVIEERLRIARELHDVVAHHVAVISVQAGVAEHLLPDRPVTAQEALRHVRRESAAILTELAGILSVLRQPDDPGTATSPPAPGMRQLPDLVGSYAEAGLAVRLSVAGEPRDLAGTADLVAYRVVQEALTNAHKYGTETARVSVSYLSGRVLLEITNAVQHPRNQLPSSGHGLQGMRERAATVSGDLQAGAVDGGGFRVRLTLPAPVVAT